MTVAEITQILTAAAAAIAALYSVLSRHAMHNIHLSMNSRLDALIETATKLARKEGYDAGRKALEEHDRMLQGKE